MFDYTLTRTKTCNYFTTLCGSLVLCRHLKLVATKYNFQVSIIHLQTRWIYPLWHKSLKIWKPGNVSHVRHLEKLNFTWHTRNIYRKVASKSTGRGGFICLQQLNKTSRERRWNVPVFMLFSCTGDSYSVSSSASLLVILDLPIKLSTLFMAVIMSLSSASCLFLDASRTLSVYLEFELCWFVLNLQLNTTTKVEFKVWIKSRVPQKTKTNI